MLSVLTPKYGLTESFWLAAIVKNYLATSLFLYAFQSFSEMKFPLTKFGKNLKNSVSIN